MWQKLQRMMAGRYGVDNLSLVLLFVSFLLININYIWLAGVGVLGYIVFRAMSRNHEQRRKELQSFEKATAGIRKLMAPAGEAAARGILSLYRKSMALRSRLKQRKDFVFVKCKGCKNTLRLPRNKGKLAAKCPVCKAEFIIKT